MTARGKQDLNPVKSSQSEEEGLEKSISVPIRAIFKQVGKVPSRAATKFLGLSQKRKPPNTRFHSVEPTRLYECFVFLNYAIHKAH